MSRWRPELITFDFGNTLALPPELPDGLYLRLALRRVGVEPDWSDEALDVLARRLNDEIERARVTVSVNAARSYWRRWAEAVLTSLGAPADGRSAARLARSYVNMRIRDCRPVSGAATVLRALRSRGYRLAVISNDEGRLRDRMRACRLEEFFEFALDSAEVGVAKPDPAIFALACDIAKLSPDKCLHVGDSWQDDVVAPMLAGMKAAWFAPGGPEPPASGPRPWAVLDRLGRLLSVLP